MTPRIPPDLLPTHAYQFTRTIRFEFNYQYNVVRVMQNDQVIGDWDYPTMTIDLNKFLLLPKVAPRRALNECFETLRKRGSIPAFLAKWRNILPLAQYQTLMSDLHYVILHAEVQYSTDLRANPNIEQDVMLAVSNINPDDKE